MHDMEELLSLEIKKEIADRYFGFRKMIEDDSQQYNQHIREAYRQLENEVGFRPDQALYPSQPGIAGP